MKAGDIIMRIHIDGKGGVTADAEYANAPEGPKITVRALMADLLASQEQRGLRKASKASTRSILKGFVACYGEYNVDDITKEIIEDWLYAQGFASMVTQNNTLRYLTVFFNHAIKRSYVRENPTKGIENVRIEQTMPEFVPVDDVVTLFERAPADIIPALAIGFFAGIRSSELHQLLWSDVKWDNNTITVQPHVAKGRRARHVDMAPNLVQWVRPHRGADMELVAPSAKRVSAQRRQILGKWVHNGMRHTYATMHVAMFENAAKTSAQLGHMNQNLLFQHYRGLATKQDAERFWGICP